MDTQSITLSAGTLNQLYSWLSRLALAGRDSRECTRFLHLCTERVREIEKARVELAKTYAKKDDDGKIVQVAGDKGLRYDFEDEAYVKFISELANILKEPITLDILPSNVENWKKIKEIVLDTKEVISAEDAEWYEEVCSLLEQCKI